MITQVHQLPPLAQQTLVNPSTGCDERRKDGNIRLGKLQKILKDDTDLADLVLTLEEHPRAEICLGQRGINERGEMILASCWLRLCAEMLEV